MNLKIFLLTPTLLLGACTVGPDYKTPELTYSDNWVQQDKSAENTSFNYLNNDDTQNSNEEQEPSYEIKTDWWTVFNDPLLEKHIALASIENKEIQAARANIKQARGLRKETKALYYPSIDSELSQTRQGTSANIGSPKTRTTTYKAGIDASWELDLFGGISRQNENEQAQLEQAVEERRAILLSVLAETARTYYGIRGLQKRINILHDNIALQQNTYDLVHNLFQMGEATEFDLSRAQGQLQLTQSRLPDLDADLKTSIFRLSILLGRAPESLLVEMQSSQPLPIPPDVVPLGLRSDILRRRPDVRLAERALAASTAEIGVAIADLYPSFSLTGNVGRSASVFSDLTSSDSNIFSIGPIFNWPIFQGGAIRANIKVQEAKAEEALIRYEQTVLNSLADVESALTNYAQKLKTRDSLKHAMMSSERSTELARVLFNAGEENFLSVLDAERELTSIKDEVVTSETDAVLYLITLYTSLGGGWVLFEDQEQHLLKDIN